MKDNIPKHIAIIPDGNRRWAKEKQLQPWEGHYEGAKRFEEILNTAFQAGVENVTFWGYSADNLKKRPWREKKALLEIYEKYFQKLLKSKKIFQEKIKINIVGRWEEQLPGKLVRLLKRGIQETKNHRNFNLNFLLAYNGDDDILMAVKNIARKIKKGGLKITKKTIAEHLLSQPVKEVDLVIRTGIEGDPHNSAGFLMWQTQNSQLYFTETKFPDFGAKELKKAIRDFARRQRRLGR